MWRKSPDLLAVTEFSVMLGVNTRPEGHRMGKNA